ncbi:hypothetical protein LJR289_004093 [Pseudoduganella sp. LjRoot289]|uniref:hypothetical protein n=1 Tax=Pseudoduganella sp. LjRoot289 TaxID=3342314 RepID=UPI003ECE35E3
MSLIERLAGLLPARRTLHVHLAPQQLLAVVRQGGRIVEGSAMRVVYANPAGQWQAAIAALRAFLAQPEAPNAVIAQRQTSAKAGTHTPHQPRQSMDSPVPVVSQAQSDAQRIPCYTLRGNDRPAGAVLRDSLAARTPLSISLSGRWCQLVLAPWSDALLAEPGASRFLHMQLSAVYGDAAGNWTVSSDDASYGQPRVACGIATGLLDALHTLAAEHGTRCAAIEPSVSAVCRSLTGKPAAFAIIEQGRMTLAALAGGRITAIQSQPCGAAWHAELPQSWQRWSLRAPELAAIGDIAVVDLSGQSGGTVAGRLPGLFRLADSPFGSAGSTEAAAQTLADAAQGSAPASGLPLSIVGGTSKREAA